MTDAPKIEIRRISEIYACLFLGEELVMRLSLDSRGLWLAEGPRLSASISKPFSSLEKARDFAAAELARHPHSLKIREALMCIRSHANDALAEAQSALGYMDSEDPGEVWEAISERIKWSNKVIRRATRAVPALNETNLDADQS